MQFMFVGRDAGDAEDPEAAASWAPDEEPGAVPADSWARGAIPVGPPRRAPAPIPPPPPTLVHGVHIWSLLSEQ